MRITEYKHLFTEQVRVAVNWRAVQRADVEVRERVVTSRSSLGALLLPWYENGGQWHSERRSRVTVKKAAALRQDSQRERILTLAAEFAAGEPGAMILPAVKLPSGVLLLDGCHRAVALHVARVPPRVVLAVLHGDRVARACMFDA